MESKTFLDRLLCTSEFDTNLDRSTIVRYFDTFDPNSCKLKEKKMLDYKKIYEVQRNLHLQRLQQTFDWFLSINGHVFKLGHFSWVQTAV